MHNYVNIPENTNYMLEIFWLQVMIPISSLLMPFSFSRFVFAEKELTGRIFICECKQWIALISKNI